MPSRMTFKQSERLKLEKSIKALFQNGKALSAYPLKLQYLKATDDADFNKVGVTVGKKNFRSAYDRNTIKRRMREAYRLNKANFDSHQKYFFFFIFYGKKEHTSYNSINNAMMKIALLLKQQNH